MESEGIRPVSALDSRNSPDWVERAVDQLTDHVYVTLDIDAFDPAYAPGTGTPEPGGLDWFQVTRLLRAVAECRTIVAADIVEVIPLPRPEHAPRRRGARAPGALKVGCPPDDTRRGSES